jgi:hypothetical protein
MCQLVRPYAADLPKLLSNSSSSPKLLKRHDGVRLDFLEVQMPGMSWLDEA